MYFIQYLQRIQSWYDEVRNLPKSAKLESYGDPSFGSKLIGHYTQLVWAETKMVGCGAISYRGRYHPRLGLFTKRYICNYYPPGNIRCVH